MSAPADAYVRLFALVCVLLSFSSTGAEATERGFLGMQVQGVSARLAEALGMEKVEGALIRDISLDGTGAAAGFRRGDLITKFNGVDIETFDRLVQVVTKTKAGDRVKVEVRRPEGTEVLTLAMGAWPKSWLVAKGAFAALPDHGLTFGSLTQKLRERFGLRWGTTGIVVTLVDEEKLEEKNPNGKLGLQRGDVIHQINLSPVWEPKQLLASYAKARREKRGALLLLVERRDGFVYLLLPVIEKKDN